MNKNNIKPPTSQEDACKNHIKLVHYVASKYKGFANKGYADYEDLVSTGVIGLIKAYRTYDSNKKTAWSNYACTCINNEILMFLRKYNRQFKLDTRSLDEVIQTRKRDNSKMTVHDLVSCDQTIDWDTRIIIKNVLSPSSNLLSDKEKIVIKLTVAGYLQDTIAQYLGHSQSFVSRLYKRGLQKIRHSIEGKEYCAKHVAK